MLFSASALTSQYSRIPACRSWSIFVPTTGLKAMTSPCPEPSFCRANNCCFKLFVSAAHGTLQSGGKLQESLFGVRPQPKTPVNFSWTLHRTCCVADNLHCHHRRRLVLIPFITEPTAEVCKAGDLNVACDCSCHYDLDKFSLLLWLQR